MPESEKRISSGEAEEKNAPQEQESPGEKSSRGWTSSRRRTRRFTLLVCFMVIMHILGAITSIRAVMSTRTSQGAVAWAVSLNTFPYVAVPAYWLLGQSRFDGYDLLRLNAQWTESETIEKASAMLQEKGLLRLPNDDRNNSFSRFLSQISKLPVTTGNSAKLLIDGQQTFDAILAGIDQAQDYVLFQFYILRDDELGQRCKDAFLKKAKEGVRVYVLYDELGSKDLSPDYIRELREGGVAIQPFNTTQGDGNRLRLNFRNHRKIVVVDGKVAYVGGHNVGDEYLGKDPILSPWRDTHVEVRGPIVQCVQAPFVEDWNWATGIVLNLNWNPERAQDGDIEAACLPTGPADTLETGTLFFLNMINRAQHRLWIVSPYFIPDEQIMSALQLASLRGVDVRVLVPQNPDHLHVWLSGLSYLEEAEDAGVKIFRYQPGFLHQKVWLIDDDVSLIGTANLDNRSMRLNFEITLMLVNEPFASEVEAMLEADFEQSQFAPATEYTERSLPYRFLVRVCRLLAPVQ